MSEFLELLRLNDAPLSDTSRHICSLWFTQWRDVRQSALKYLKNVESFPPASEIDDAPVSGMLRCTLAQRYAQWRYRTSIAANVSENVDLLIEV